MSFAPITITITHPGEDIDIGNTADPRLVFTRIASFLDGVVNGSKGAAGTTVAYSTGGARATGTVTIGSAVGIAASGTVTLAGGAGNVTITVNGTPVGPVIFNTDDTTTAADCVTALNGNVTVAALVTATSLGAVITLTADAKGTAGNSITLTSSRTAGSATASGATLAGGAQAVTVALDGTSVSVATEGVDDYATATLVAAALNGNGTVASNVTSTTLGKQILLTAVAYGTAPNAFTLTSAAGGGSAVASGATLSGGGAATSTTYTR